MKDAFPALRTKLKADSTWVRWCRELYRGHGGERIKTTLPFVEVTATTTPFDTFADDIDRHLLTFTLFARGQEATWIDNMIFETSRMLDHASVASVKYKTAGMTLLDTPVTPIVTDGVWQASMDYDMIVHYVTKNPVTRDA